MQMRALGMASDHVLSAKLVLACGDLITVSPSNNPDLFWAIRGGGTYGIIVEATLNILQLPRSAMVSIQYPVKSTRYDVARKYLDWAPRQVKEFGSQINMYNNRTQLIGWYLGASLNQLQEMMATSGLLQIEGAKVSLSGDCNTDNSRLFWTYTVDQCVPDIQVQSKYASWFNVVPESFQPIEPRFQFDEVPANTHQPPANPWPRFRIINKTFFIQKSKPVSNETLKGLIERTGALPDSAGYWAELTAFNITSRGTSNSSAFPWQEEGYALLRSEVDYGSTATEEHAQNKKFMTDLETYLLPRIG